MRLFKLLGKQKQPKPKIRRRKEIIEIISDINGIETKRPIKRINEAKSWFSEKINRFNKPLAKQIDNTLDGIISHVRGSTELTFVEVAVLLNAIYRFGTISVKIPITFLTELEFTWKHKSSNNQVILIPLYTDGGDVN
jgi:hypothetical protein